MKLDEPVTQLLPELAELSVITGSQGDEVKTGVTRWSSRSRFRRS